ncbi:hypothetical protein BASA81_003582 [Batrachochytrium salamandrivorans]|nr:hypothetical protein BASA81_003582 [Batrachochytrium salamandrivorans]
MVRDVAPGRVVLIGASMGGWIAHLLALKLPSKVCGLVAVGCAPDFHRGAHLPPTAPRAKNRAGANGEGGDRVEVLAHQHLRDLGPDCRCAPALASPKPFQPAHNRSRQVRVLKGNRSD